MNGKQLEIHLIWDHVLCDGSLKTWHGEVVYLPFVSESKCQNSNIHSKDCMKDMIRDIREDSFHKHTCMICWKTI